MRVASGLYGGPGGGTYGASGVTIGEAHAFLGQAVNVGGFVKVGTLAGQVHPTHVVDEDQNDVGRLLVGMPCEAKGKA